LNEILEKTKSAKMGRLKRQMLLRKLGIEPAAATRAPEEEAQMRARMAERITLQRRMTLTPGLAAWLWEDEHKLRERARLIVAAWREAKEHSASASSCASRPAGGSDKLDPYKIAFENLSRSRYPEDLVEFKRRMALFRQLVSEEAPHGA
jgi:hypothetical protein